jgi:hypothetical protein
MSHAPETVRPLDPSKPVGDSPALAQASGSAVRLRGLKIQKEDEDSVWATYKRHDIDCTQHWRKAGVWNYEVRNRAGEVVATGRWEGAGRLGMIHAAIHAAELDSPNDVVSHAAPEPRPLDHSQPVGTTRPR